MGHEPSQVPSRAQLQQMLKHQQQQLEKLHVVQAQLRARVAELEERFADEAVEKRLQEEEQATRDALRHLDYVEYLAEGKLAEMMANVHGRSPTGQSLKNTLVRAIRSMKPEKLSYQAPESRHYDVLCLTYLKKKKAEEVAGAVEISERQYYRDLKAAIQRVTDQVLASGDED